MIGASGLIAAAKANSKFGPAGGPAGDQRWCAARRRTEEGRRVRPVDASRTRWLSSVQRFALHTRFYMGVRFEKPVGDSRLPRGFSRLAEPQIGEPIATIANYGTQYAASFSMPATIFSVFTCQALSRLGLKGMAGTSGPVTRMMGPSRSSKASSLRIAASSAP